MPQNLVSEIVRPSPEASELLDVSAPLAAAATRVRVDPSEDGVMTPVDQTQQSEDANLRKIVAQLHMNLGRPSNDALATAIRLSGGSEDAIQAALKVRCTVCERLTEPSPVPAASLRRWTEFGQCLALDLFMFADITGQNGLFLNMLDMASHCKVVFPVADKNPLTVSYGFLLGWCLTLGVPECLRFDLGSEFESSLSELAEQIGCRLLPAAAVSPTQNAPCERAGGAWKVPRTTPGGPIFDQVGRFFDKIVASCSLELVNEHSNWTQWAQSCLADPCVPLSSSYLVRHS